MRSGSSATLRSVDWYFVTDDSGQLIGPIFKGQEIQEEITHGMYSCIQVSVCKRKG
jgi:hypothetical protein